MLLPELGEYRDHQLAQPVAPLALCPIDGLEEERQGPFIVLGDERLENLGRLAALLQLGDDSRRRARPGQLVEEVRDRGARQGADELADDLTVAERLDRRNPLDTEPFRKLRVGI